MTTVQQGGVTRFYLDGEQDELTAWTASLTMKKPDGAGGLVPLALAEITTLTLTLYNLSTLAIINSITDVDIKNTGRGVMHATSGVLTVTFEDADNPITAGGEWHVGLIEAAYNGGTRTARAELVFRMRDLEKVP